MALDKPIDWDPEDRRLPRLPPLADRPAAYIDKSMGADEYPDEDSAEGIVELIDSVFLDAAPAADSLKCRKRKDGRAAQQLKPVNLQGEARATDTDACAPRKPLHLRSPAARD